MGAGFKRRDVGVGVNTPRQHLGVGATTGEVVAFCLNVALVSKAVFFIAGQCSLPRQIKTTLWSSQSPGLNPNEYLWTVVERKMDSHKPSNRAELIEYLCKEWLMVNQQQSGGAHVKAHESHH